MVEWNVERKNAVWREVLGARDEVAKDRCMEIYKEKKKVKIYTRAKQT